MNNQDDARKIFDRFDKDGSGSIEVRELEALLRTLGTKFDEERLLSAMSNLRTARPNRVSWEEFQAMWSDLQSPARSIPKRAEPDASTDDARPRAKAEPFDLRAVFRRFDKDGSGYIDVGELAAMLQAMGMEPDDDQLDQAIERLDTDHSGRISWDEFQTWWNERGL